jgi:hypothetical protein
VPFTDDGVAGTTDPKTRDLWRSRLPLILPTSEDLKEDVEDRRFLPFSTGACFVLTKNLEKKTEELQRDEMFFQHVVGERTVL